MAIEKDPFTVKWYLDDRKYKLNPLKQVPLKIDVYNRSTQKHKHYNVNEYFTRAEWEQINSINVSDPQKEATRDQIQRKAQLDAIMQKFRDCNNSKIATTLTQFNNALTGNVISKKTDAAYLFQIFDKFIETRENISTIEYYEAASKKFFTFTTIYNKEKAEDFLIDDLDKPFIEEFRKWYVAQTINSSENTANSYLRALRAVLNWASKKRQGYIKKKQNVFKYDNIVIPEATRRASKYTFSEANLKTFLLSPVTTREEERAKDLFIFMFLFDGIRIGDVFRLENKNIETRDGLTWINFTPLKTSKSSGKSSRVEITPEIKSIIDKHSGDEKYVFDILNKDMDEDQVRRKIKSKTSTINENLKKLARRVGIDRHISPSVARYSVNHYLTTKGYTTREQQSEMMVNSPKVNKGYFDGLDEKFKIQRKLGNILDKDDSIQTKVKDPINLQIKDSEPKDDHESLINYIFSQSPHFSDNQIRELLKTANINFVKGKDLAGQLKARSEITIDKLKTLISLMNESKNYLDEKSKFKRLI